MIKTRLTWFNFNYSKTCGASGHGNCLDTPVYNGKGAGRGGQRRVKSLFKACIAICITGFDVKTNENCHYRI